MKADDLQTLSKTSAGPEMGKSEGEHAKDQDKTHIIKKQKEDISSLHSSAAAAGAATSGAAENSPVAEAAAVAATAVVASAAGRNLRTFLVAVPRERRACAAFWLTHSTIK